MEKISWTAHVSNEEVLSLVHVIKQRQANWIGHVLRHDCFLKTVLKEKLDKKRPRGRRKMLQEDKKISYEEPKRGAESQVGWRHCQ